MIFPGRLRELLPKQKTKEELDEHYDNIELEKGDFLAMVIAAFITFMPILIAIMAVMFGFLWLLVRA
jgi:hypothetical protein